MHVENGLTSLRSIWYLDRPSLTHIIFSLGSWNTHGKRVHSFIFLSLCRLVTLVTMKVSPPLVLLGLLLASSSTTIQAWALKTKKACLGKAIYRRGFLVGAATAVVVGTATAAGAAVAVNQQIVNTNNNKQAPYEPIPNSLTDQVILITGGSTGLGLESAKRLAAAGATIVLTSRTLSKGETAVQSVQDYLTGKKGMPQGKIYNLVLDLDDLSSVKAFPGLFKTLSLGPIDVLLNNAGVMAIPDRQLTKDGYERTFQSNHLGHFVLTAELYPFLNRNKSTVINVSSEAYNFAQTSSGPSKSGLDLNNLNGERQYGAWSSYGLSKLANILFTKELQSRADAAGENWLTTVTLHPGAVQTDLGRNLIGEEKWNDLKTNGPTGLQAVVFSALNAVTKTVPEGASTQIFLAAGADGTLKKGAFYEDLKEKRNLPKWATDETAAKALWKRSEELGGIQFDLGSSTTTTTTTTTSSSSNEKVILTEAEAEIKPDDAPETAES
jgi:NAD(P)-dependent dehydrogenase (short-subunit alcohol dehydrogenase family)